MDKNLEVLAVGVDAVHVEVGCCLIALAIIC